MHLKQIMMVGLLLLHLPQMVEAQYILPDFQSQTVDKNQLLIRWEPRTLAEWENAQKEGYQIKIYQGNQEDNLTLQSSQNIKALSAPEWDQAIAEQRDSLMRSFYEGAKSFLYMPPEIIAELKTSLEAEEGKSIEQTVDEFRLGYLTYAITFDYDLIRKAGLGYAIPLTDANYYRIEVQTGNFTAFTFDHSKKPIARSPFPDLKANFSDKKVEVEWETPDFKTTYFGYFLSISENGKQYKGVSDMP
ncbi:MAG: hypothetical protein AAF985_07395, partial [Bacteroidota bacterium]